MKAIPMALFIAAVLFMGAAVNAGFHAGQDNPEAKNILEARPKTEQK
jgi:hypothetical protein